MNAINFDEQNDNQELLTQMTAEVVSAYVGGNAVQAADLPTLIADVHAALSKLSSASSMAEAEKPEPAVNPKRSVTREYIVCLEDGKKFKSLKRHLMSHYGMTPEEYREKWGLRPDYPMVAPEYAERRSQLARDMGLGRRPDEKASKRKK